MIYKIIEKTDDYHAGRSAVHRGKREVLIANDFTLDEARKELLNMFNCVYDEFFSTWEDVLSSDYGNMVFVFLDGTMSFEYDVFVYSIEKEAI